MPERSANDDDLQQRGDEERVRGIAEDDDDFDEDDNEDFDDTEDGEEGTL